MNFKFLKKMGRIYYIMSKDRTVVQVRVHSVKILYSNLETSVKITSICRLKKFVTYSLTYIHRVQKQRLNFSLQMGYTVFQLKTEFVILMQNTAKVPQTLNLLHIASSIHMKLNRWWNLNITFRIESVN